MDILVESEKKRRLEEITEISNKKQKLPKKRVAVIIGYIGTNYSGLQYQEHQPNIPTIEKELFAACVKSGGTCILRY
jgi:tRNA pseudouridine38-40 synthase